MNKAIVLPRRSSAGPARQEDFDDLVDQLGDGATVLLSVGVSLASGVNKIRHNLKGTPRSVTFAPYSNVAWWSPTRPDGTFVYIQTAGAVEGDVQVWV